MTADDGVDISGMPAYSPKPNATAADDVDISHMPAYHKPTDYSEDDSPEAAEAKAQAGAGEAVAHYATQGAGAIAGGVTFLGGSILHGVGALLGYSMGADPSKVTDWLVKKHDEDRDLFNDVTNFFTYNPRTTQGQDLVDLGDKGMAQLTRPTHDVLHDLGAPKALTDKIPMPGPGTQAALDIGGDVLKLSGAVGAPGLAEGGLAAARGTVRTVGDAVRSNLRRAAPAAEATPALKPAANAVTPEALQAGPDPVPQPVHGDPAPASVAVQKPRIRPRAGESAQEAAARQGIPVEPQASTPPGPAREAAPGTLSAAATGEPVAPDRMFHPTAEDGPRQGGVPQAEQDANAQAMDDLDTLSGGVMGGQRRVGALTGDYNATGTEHQNAQIPDAAGKRMQAQIENEHNALRTASEKNAESVGSAANNDIDPTTTKFRGGIVRSAVQAIEDHFNRAINGMYASVRAKFGSAPIPELSRLKAFVNDDANFSNPYEQGLQRSVKAQMDRFWSSGDPARNIPPGSVDAAEELRKFINSKYHDDSANVGKQMKQLIDLDVAQHAGGDHFATARNLMEHRERLLEPTGPNELRRPRDRNKLDNKVDSEGIMDHVTGLDSEHFEHFMNVLKQGARLGNGELAPLMARATREIQGHVLAKIHSKSVTEGGRWNARNFAREANQHSANLPTLFRDNPKVLENLQTINRAGNAMKMDTSYPGAVAQGVKTGIIGGLVQKGVKASGLAGKVAGAAHGNLLLAGAAHLAEKGAETTLNKITAARRNRAVGRSLVQSPLGHRIPGQGGWIGDVNHLPDTEHFIDDDGAHVVRSANGETRAIDKGNDIQIKGTHTAESGRGNGEGVARMKHLADIASERGGRLLSDDTVSASALKTYPALKHMGYDVQAHPYQETGTGGRTAWQGPGSGEPVFSVGAPERARGGMGRPSEDQYRATAGITGPDLGNQPARGVDMTKPQAPRSTESTPLGQTAAFKRQAGNARVMPEWMGATDEGETGHMLNIGLHVGKTNTAIHPNSVLEALQAHGVKAGDYTIHQSETEPTMVVHTDKALGKKQGDSLSRSLGQEAIAERNPDGTGQLHGPKAGEWGPYNPDYFMMGDGRTASAHAADTSFNPEELEKQAPKQTVTNPQRNAYPGIYDHPKDIMERVKTAPEDPMLKRLFGVTRKDLHDTAVARGDIAPDKIPGVTQRGKGSKIAQSVTTDENAARLRDTISAFKEAHPEAYHGMVGWYEMHPMYESIKKIVGAKAASKVYEKFNTLMGMASPGSEVTSEINRGTAAHMMSEQGKFDKFVKYGGNPNTRAAMKNAPELRDVNGHPYHSTSQAKPMVNFLDLGQGAKGPKTSMYIRASDAPQRPGTTFQNKVLVGDSHWARGVGLSDVRTAKDFSGSVAGSELKSIHDWYHENVAKKVNLPSTSAQAVQWGALSHETGVSTPIGATKLELLAGEVAKAAKRLGVEPEEAWTRIVKGLAHAG